MVSYHAEILYALANEYQCTRIQLDFEISVALCLKHRL